MITEKFKQAIGRVRVRAAGREVSRGTSFLVTPELALTALHVVSEGSPVEPLGEIVVEFPTVTCRAELVDRGWDSYLDWALLRLLDKPDVDPIPLSDAITHGEDRTFYTWGYPDLNALDGKTFEGSVRDPRATYGGNAPAIELYSEETKGVAVAGLSGAPCVVAGRAVGLIRSALIEADRGLGTLYCSPAAGILRAQVLDQAFASPFKGLRPFEEVDEPFFYGRREEIRRLLLRLNPNSRLLTLVGDSGSGKSSLAHAGLVPALRRGDLQQDFDWTVVKLRVGARPLHELALWLGKETGLLNSRELPRIRESLEGATEGLSDLVDEAVVGRGSRARLLLVVDQLEELFTGDLNDQQRRHFLRNIGHASLVEGGRTWVLMTLRADYMGRLLGLVDNPEVFRRSIEIIYPVPSNKLIEVVQEPAAKAGLELEEGLAQRLVEEVSEQPGALPLLQFALELLWDRRESNRLTWAGYAKFKSVREAITEVADEALASLELEDERAVARQVFESLVKFGDGASSRRRVALDFLERIAPRRVRPIVNRFVAARLLTVSENEVEIAHEALIREWKTLRSWIDQSRNQRVVAERLFEATAEWKAGDRRLDMLYRGSRLDAALAMASGRLRELEAEQTEVGEFLLLSALFDDREVPYLHQEMGLEQSLAAADLALASDVAVYRMAGIRLLEALPEHGAAEISRRLFERIDQDDDPDCVDEAARALWTRGHLSELILAQTEAKPGLGRLRSALASLRNLPASATETRKAIADKAGKRVRQLATARLFWDEKERLAQALLVVYVAMQVAVICLSFFLRIISRYSGLNLGGSVLGTFDLLVLLTIGCCVAKRLEIDGQPFVGKSALATGAWTALAADGPFLVGSLLSSPASDWRMKLPQVGGLVLSSLPTFLGASTLALYFHEGGGRPRSPRYSLRIAFLAAFLASLSSVLLVPLLAPTLTFAAGQPFKLWLRPMGDLASTIISSSVAGAFVFLSALFGFQIWLESLPPAPKASEIWASRLADRVGWKLPRVLRLKEAFLQVLTLAVVALGAGTFSYFYDLPITPEQQRDRGNDLVGRGLLKMGREDIDQACLRGSKGACSELAEGFLTGSRPADVKDIVQAAAYFSRACEAKAKSDYNPSCGEIKYVLDRIGVEEERSSLLAAFKSECETGHLATCFSLAEVYREGRGVRQDRDLARRFYEVSCRGGFEEGCRQAKEVSADRIP